VFKITTNCSNKTESFSWYLPHAGWKVRREIPSELQQYAAKRDRPTTEESEQGHMSGLVSPTISQYPPWYRHRKHIRTTRLVSFPSSAQHLVEIPVPIAVRFFTGQTPLVMPNQQRYHYYVVLYVLCSTMKHYVSSEGRQQWDYHHHCGLKTPPGLNHFPHHMTHVTENMGSGKCAPVFHMHPNVSVTFWSEL